MSLNLRNESYSPKSMSEAGFEASHSFEAKTKVARKILVQYTISASAPYCFSGGGKTRQKTFTVPLTADGSPSKQYNRYELAGAVERDDSGAEVPAVMLVGFKAIVKDRIKEPIIPDEWVKGTTIRVTILTAALKKLRREKGLSVSELAETTGVQESTIRAAEKGLTVSDEARQSLEATLLSMDL